MVENYFIWHDPLFREFTGPSYDRLYLLILTIDVIHKPGFFREVRESTTQVPDSELI